MSATPQKNIDIGFNQEKETVISGNPSLKNVVVSFYNLPSHFFDPQ
jgi:hypothetical protein